MRKPDGLSVFGFQVIPPKARIFEEKRYDLNCGAYSNHIRNQLINDHAATRRANRRLVHFNDFAGQHATNMLGKLKVCLIPLIPNRIIFRLLA